jgi:hypothetical protein
MFIKIKKNITEVFRKLQTSKFLKEFILYKINPFLKLVLIIALEVGVCITKNLYHSI